MDDDLKSVESSKKEGKEEMGLDSATRVAAAACLGRKTEGGVGFVGKHRMTAAVSHLDTQIKFLQEELNELEKFGESSAICKEIVANVEAIPDPLLPLSIGPARVEWDRWFRGAHNTSSKRRWI